MQIETIGAIGAGTMGNGIAQGFAAAGFAIVLQDLSQEALGRARKTMETSLGRQVKKVALTAEQAGRRWRGW